MPRRLLAHRVHAMAGEEMRMTVEQFPGDDPYTGSGLPALGLRNYWYPVIAAWRLGRKPKAAKVLGEDIVLFRDGGKLFALGNRCPHRGAPLSQGKCLYPGSGTISCPYHGWTFSGETGVCVAKLMEGPDATASRQIAVKSYPVREMRGAIFVFVGDIEAPPLEDEVPDVLRARDDWHGFSTWRTYRCNWRIMKDNLCHDMHAPYVHRNSPELMFQPVFPFASRLAAFPLDADNGIGYVAKDGIPSANYPGLGTFPPKNETWYRFLKPTGRGKEIDPKAQAVVKFGIKYRQSSLMPGATFIGRPNGNYFALRWVTPIDAESCFYYSWSLFRRQSWWRTLKERAFWLIWVSWAHDWLFSDQDKRILEKVISGRETYSRTDAGVIAWRRYAADHARRRAAASAKTAEILQPPAAE
ncbi:MAG TPA: aromatic ring-hydroxylating dioxygenase subunit alpha [Stellaceae bacterium]|nr:aromatic ring-hydroxylating dioxygenase subunit alpha [Stellaceae bacterium]